MISHRSLSNNTENGQHILPVEPGQRVVSMLPLAHMFGQLADFLYPFSAGATIYYLTKAPTPSILLKAMADVKPYLVATVPLVIEKIHKKKLDPLLSKTVLKVC
jgi:long-chain acyl-CoA synthetase